MPEPLASQFPDGVLAPVHLVIRLRTFKYYKAINVHLVRALQMA